jgi:hypothetical protein
MRFPMAGILRAGESAAGYPVDFVAFHHRGLRFNLSDALRRIVSRVVHER